MGPALCLFGASGCALLGGIDGDDYARSGSGATASGVGANGGGGSDVGGAGAGGASSWQRTMFLSSTAQTPDFRGGAQAGADAICKMLADAGSATPKGKQWRAWLSKFNETAGDRIGCGSDGSSLGPFVRVDGEPIAETCEGLLSGNLMTAPILDEDGDVPGGSAWTGTRADGANTGVDCSGWTVDIMSVEATYGTPDALIDAWTEGGTATCNNPNRVYCFQYGD
jgi:hypothetical protein